MILGIYGAGGCGRETLELAQLINARSQYWSDIVFIDEYIGKAEVNEARVYSYEESKNLGDDIEYVVAIGEVAIKRKEYEKLLQDNANIATLIHPDVHIPKTTVVGKGSIICDSTFISCNVTIGENVLISPHVDVSHDCIIGDGTVVAGSCSIAGACTIGSDVFLGMSSAIREKVSVGNEVIVGMAAAVINSIEDGMVVAGNPASIIRKNDGKRIFR